MAPTPRKSNLAPRLDKPHESELKPKFGPSSIPGAHHSDATVPLQRNLQGKDVLLATDRWSTNAPAL